MPTIRAISINFPVETRTGPEASDAQSRALNLDEAHFRVGVPGEPDFRVGEILIDEEAGKFTLKSPHTSRMTGEPLVVHGSLVNVSYQELTPAQARKYYPHEFKEHGTPAAAAQQGKQARS